MPLYFYFLLCIYSRNQQQGLLLLQHIMPLEKCLRQEQATLEEPSSRSSAFSAPCSRLVSTASSWPPSFPSSGAEEGMD